jgi:response regulator RpfG family c-di-GMP phosphodiesterase
MPQMTELPVKEVLARKCRILVVDDEPVNLLVLERVLNSTYDVCLAGSGYEAIRKVKEIAPDLIILDVMMPDLSGFDVCRIIKAEGTFADVPVLFLTAMDTPEGESMGLELGAIDYLSKPVNLELLRLRVRNHLALKMRNDLVREQRDLLARQKQELTEAMARIKRLEGIIPICMHCKSIRADNASWERLESYISEHTDALFSHGVCPSCMAQHYPEIVQKA